VRRRLDPKLAGNFKISLGLPLVLATGMARRPRLLLKGASYHVMARGNRRGKIFRSDADRLNFLERLSQACEKYHVRWRTFVIMNTHYHMIAETPYANLSEVMQFVNGTFTQDWNRRHKTTGHVFEGRFHSVLIETGQYMRNVYRYIALNPVEAGYVDSPTAWPWSGHRAVAGLVRAPEFLDLDNLEVSFGGSTKAEAQRYYREFIRVSADDDVDRAEQVVVGSERFKSNVRELIGDRLYLVNVPKSYRALARPSLGHLFMRLGDDLERRNRMILRAQVVYGYTQSEIARALGLHPDTVSVVVRRIKRQRYFLVNAR
jgi:putative transposase